MSEERFDYKEYAPHKYTSRRYQIINFFLLFIPLWILFFLLRIKTNEPEMLIILSLLVALTLFCVIAILKPPIIIIDYKNEEIRLNHKYFGKKTFAFNKIEYIEIAEKEFKYNTELGRTTSLLNFQTSLSGDFSPKAFCISIVNKQKKSDILDLYPHILLINELSKKFKINFRDEHTKYKYYRYQFKCIFLGIFALFIFGLLVFVYLLIN